MQVMKQKKQTVVRSLDYWRDQSTHRCDGGAMFTQLTNIFNDILFILLSAGTLSRLFDYTQLKAASGFSLPCLFFFF